MKIVTLSCIAGIAGVVDKNGNLFTEECDCGMSYCKGWVVRPHPNIEELKKVLPHLSKAVPDVIEDIFKK
jgi:hypothetical protein